MRRGTALAMALLSMSLGQVVRAEAQTPDANPAFQSAEGVVKELYDLVTFGAGTTPDWDHVRSLFLAEAIIVLRTSREATSVFSVDGFVADFVQFIEQANVEESGFVERILCTSTTEFGDMAHSLVLYEASIPGRERPPSQGVDSFQLIRKTGRWWIVSITNEIPTPERPVPEVFRSGCAR